MRWWRQLEESFGGRLLIWVVIGAILAVIKVVFSEPLEPGDGLVLLGVLVGGELGHTMRRRGSGENRPHRERPEKLL